MSNTQYDNTNTGALFKNDKEGNDKRPDYKGKIDIGGREYWLSAWVRTKKDGSGKYLSLKAEAKDQPPQTQHNQAKANAYQPPAVRDDDGNDEIPF